MSTDSPQGRYWIGTIPHSLGWVPPTNLPDGVNWIRGQSEVGAGGLHHFQVCVAFSKNRRRQAVRNLLPGHWELTRSVAAEDYVWKEDTRVAGSQFELGRRPFKRNSATDWEAVRTSAKAGKLEEVPADVFIKHYSALRRIAADSCRPVPAIRTCHVFWGATGTGKSRRAWEEAGIQAYAKAPLTKWWCGYDGELNVIIDEFRGILSVSNLLRWLDRYPVRVETKGGSVPLCATTFWITSNVSPDDWYPDIDPATLEALRRRMNITHFS